MKLPNGPMTKTALAVQAMREAILRGEITADGPLTVARLAAQLGMSPTPVREAIRTLQAEGLLRHEPHHSVSVARYSAKDVHDIFQLRAQLEAQAARLAAPRLTDAHLDRLDALQREMRQAARRDDIDGLNRLNAEWHLAIYGAAENHVLLDLIAHLWRKFMWEGNWITASHAEHSLSEHDQILAALRARDANRAVALLRAHIRRGEEATVHYLALPGKSIT